MELNNELLPKCIVDAFRDVIPIDEINKFLIGFDEASKCDQFSHLKDEDSRDFIDIPKDKMLFGEVNRLTHGDRNYRLNNPCYDYFCERLFGSLFSTGFLKVNKICCEIIGIHVKTISNFVNLRVTEMETEVDSHKIRIYKLSWTITQEGDPYYFVMNKEDLPILCDMIFKQSSGESFSNYLSSIISEYLYEDCQLVWFSLPSVVNLTNYVNSIAESAHSNKPHREK